MRREPARPSGRRSEGTVAECVWAAAMFQIKRVRVASVGAGLTVSVCRSLAARRGEARMLAAGLLLEARTTRT